MVFCAHKDRIDQTTTATFSLLNEFFALTANLHSPNSAVICHASFREQPLHPLTLFPTSHLKLQPPTNPDQEPNPEEESQSALFSPTQTNIPTLTHITNHKQKHAYKSSQTHTYTNTNKTQTQTYKDSHTHTLKARQTITYTHTLTETITHTRTHTKPHKLYHTRIHIHIHTITGKHTHTHSHTYKHTHTHTYKPIHIAWPMEIAKETDSEDRS